MADTLESLEIKVEHGATGAANEIKSVTDAISKLSGSITRALPKLKSFAESLEKMSSQVVIQDFHGSTVNNIKQSVSAKAQAAIKEANESVVGQLEFDPGKEGTIVSALPEDLQETIQNASKLDIIMHKITSSVQKMHDAFQKGNEDRAWREKEKAMNAYEQSLREIAKQNPEMADDNASAVMPQDLRDFISSASQIDLLRQKLDDLHDAMQRAFEAGDKGKALSIREKIIQTESALQKAEKAAQGASKAVEEVGKSAKKAEVPLSTFVSSLKRIAFYRIIRGAIKAVTQAFQEGLEKAYLFSQGIEGEGHRFAEALDRMKSAGNAMKGQLGSAFIGLLAAVEPILISLINIITAVADAISQLMAAFTGGTYLKANQTAAQFADTMARGGGAAKEWKNQLLGFDEINRLNEPNKGGGGGGTDPLAGYEFVETPIAEKWKKIAETLRPILDGIKLMFKGLAEFIEGFLNGDWAMMFNGLGTIVEGFGQTVSGVITFVRDIIDNFFLFIEDGIVELGKKLDEKLGAGGTFEKIGKVIADVFEGIRKIIHESLTLIGEDVSHLCGMVSDLLEGDFSGAWEHAKALLVENTSIMGNSVTEMAIKTVGGANEAGNAVRGLGSKVAGGLAGAANATADFADVASTNLTTVRSQIAATGQSGLQAIGTESGISFVARIANAVSVIKRMIAGGFAGGGFPPEGQFFFAGEAGPELVGTMGGRTAVANQQEITEGIRQAVYDAMLSASNNGNNDVSVKVYLDSKEIKAGQQRLNRAWGV